MCEFEVDVDLMSLGGDSALALLDEGFHKDESNNTVNFLIPIALNLLSVSDTGFSKGKC